MADLFKDGRLVLYGAPSYMAFFKSTSKRTPKSTPRFQPGLWNLKRRITEFGSYIGYSDLFVSISDDNDGLWSLASGVKTQLPFLGPESLNFYGAQRYINHGRSEAKNAFEDLVMV